MTSAVLASNRGETTLRLTLRGRLDGRSEAAVEASVRIDSRHHGADEPRPISVRLEGSIVGLEALRLLERELAEWLSLPLDALSERRLTSSHELAFVPGQELRLEFGPRADTIADRHEVLTVTFGAGSLRGTTRLVTDQSCLRIFHEGLAEALRDAGG